MTFHDHLVVVDDNELDDDTNHHAADNCAAPADNVAPDHRDLHAHTRHRRRELPALGNRRAQVDVVGEQRGTVHVYDAVGTFDSTTKSGNVTPCPDKNNPPGSTCEAAPGKYVYTLDAYNSANQLVLHRTQTLTINSP